MPEFDVYGYRFVIDGDARGAIDGLASDFAFFASNGAGGARPPATIRIRDAEPDYGRVPALTAMAYTPRNTSYGDTRTTYVDYHGRGLGIHDRLTGDFEIATRDVDLQYEACYLFLLAALGEALDTRGLHRVHALGASLDGRAMLVLLPMGGGKSTLFWQLLQLPDVRLLSDDSPFIDRAGAVHAFPTRLGLLPGGEETVPAEHRRVVRRMEFGPKVMVDYQYFAARVVGRADPSFVFIGHRTLADGTRIEPATARQAWRAMLANCVVGLGLFQGLEFLLTRRVQEMVARAPVGWSRLCASRVLLKRSKVLNLYLGRDREAGAAALLDYVRRR